jgi:hypothetical protein
MGLSLSSGMLALVRKRVSTGLSQEPGSSIDEYVETIDFIPVNVIIIGLPYIASPVLPTPTNPLILHFDLHLFQILSFVPFPHLRRQIAPLMFLRLYPFGKFMPTHP